ncbi:hypothetical protein [Streptomyces sp. NPDC047525]|uniref:hypothetical protein n=1 Tax=Streptomyces sp. NPDC047525 TaxID=3155264 RepID=UPI0033E16539
MSDKQQHAPALTTSQAVATGQEVYYRIVSGKCINVKAELDAAYGATRAERRMYMERLTTAARAGLSNARRRAESSWERMREPELTAANVRMDGFFETITRAQFEIELWTSLIEALETSRDAVTAWHEQMANARQISQGRKGGMGHPVADARRHLWLEANREFEQNAADYFRRVS